MKKQIFNPYLPPSEYIPDGEPRVFCDRLYIYGSHDKFGGSWYCENDYVTWSAPLDDLSDWGYEGVIYTKEQDNRNGNLYAPDVIQGLDSRYYLYYSKDDTSVIGVAVCDTPAGKYEFIGEVSYADGRIVGDSEGEYFMFDPSVLIDDGRIWLYSGSSKRSTTTKIKRNMVGCVVMELEADMVTVKQEPKVVMEGGGSWFSATYFEAPSARKINDLYYLIYPTRDAGGLHYATSRFPDRDFVQRGRIHSTSDVGLNGHTVQNPAYPVGNTHGGLVCIHGQWYIFDHRMTNKTSFSRQGVAEPVTIAEDGSIAQAEATSCGLNGGPLQDEGTYPAYIACNLMGRKIFDSLQLPMTVPYVTQDGEDDAPDAYSYVAGMKNGSVVGYKYFDFRGGVYKLNLTYRGGDGILSVSTDEKGEQQIGSFHLSSTGEWSEAEILLNISKGKQALFFTYKGKGQIDMKEFELIKLEES